MDLPLLFSPCYYSLGYSLSHQHSYFRWPTQGIAMPTLRTTMGRTTMLQTHHRPLCLPLSKCELCKHRYFRPCSRPPQPRDRPGDFKRTKPPTFSHTMEPMVADDWLKSVEKKMQVVQCNNCEKVLLGSHQLSGPAADWWDA
jgi:hypothetical protein